MTGPSWWPARVMVPKPTSSHETDTPAACCQLPARPSLQAHRSCCGSATGDRAATRSGVGACRAHRQRWTRVCIPVRSMAATVASDAPRDCTSSIWGSSCWSVHTSSREARTGSALSPAHTCRGHMRVNGKRISSCVAQLIVSKPLGGAGTHMLTACQNAVHGQPGLRLNLQWVSPLRTASTGCMPPLVDPRR